MGIAKERKKDMTELKLKSANIISQAGGTDGLYEITLQCPMSCVRGQIVEVIGLEVEIKSKEI